MVRTPTTRRIMDGKKVKTIGGGSGGRSIVGLALALVLVALAPLPVSSETAPDEDLSRSYLYMTGQGVGLESEHGYCAGERIYELSPDPPVNREPVLIQGPRAEGWYSCMVWFTYTVQESFALRHGAQFTFWVGCHEPHVGASLQPAWDLLQEVGDGHNTGDVMIHIRKNWKVVETVHAPLDVAYVCGLDEPFRVDSVFRPQADVRFQAGDELMVDVMFHHAVDPAEEIYFFAVDSTNYPSSLYELGLPGSLRADFTTTIVADVPQREMEAGPGLAARYPVTVTNTGETAREVRVAVEEVGRWVVLVDPARVTVPAGGQVDLNITVRAPDDAASGIRVEHLVSVEPDGEPEIRFKTSTHVVSGMGFPFTLPGEDEGGGLAWFGGFVAALWVETLATVLVASAVTAVHFLRKRGRVRL